MYRKNVLKLGSQNYSRFGCQIYVELQWFFTLGAAPVTPSRGGIVRNGTAITHYPGSQLSMRTVSYIEINSTLASAVILHYNCL